MTQDRILILDFGSQYTQLIARRVRELHVYCEIHPYGLRPETIRAFAPRGIILSGSPASIYQENAPLPPREILTLNVPILGICYGLCVLASWSGGVVTSATAREYGRAALTIGEEAPLFAGLPSPQVVWMSHGDRLETLPTGFRQIAYTDNSPYAALQHETQPFFAVQFHPEVAHTPQGKEILANFLFRICRCSPTWTMRSFIERATSTIREQVKEGRVLCALSGGVDSAVTALLVHRAVGERLTCVFVNNGLLRKGEAEEVPRTFGERLSLPLVAVDAEKRFLSRLEGITDPEQKRKIIGLEFISVFEKEAISRGHFDFLAQGTLYPDVIESVSVAGPSAVIKSHHNVGGLPERMPFRLIEPLRELFKDEVRELGRELGLPDEVLWRHPFPGPGLAVRIVGEVTPLRLTLLREADAIMEEEVKRAGLTRELWQAFAVLLPVKTVGVMGDERTYENVVALRAVTSQDGMTADWARLPHELLDVISRRIVSEVKGVNRVVVDITSKPPATIEWE